MALAAGAIAVRAAAQGQPLPKSVTIGTNPAGTVYFALASGIAKVVSGAAGYQMVVQPHAGTSTMLPLINSGEMEFGIQNGVDLWLAYRGPAHQIGGRDLQRVAPRGADLPAAAPPPQALADHLLLHRLVRLTTMPSWASCAVTRGDP